MNVDGVPARTLLLQKPVWITVTRPLGLDVDRRQFLKSSGAAAVLVSAAGCTGLGAGEQDQSGNQDDTTVKPEDAGVFDVEPDILDEKMGKEVKVKNHQLFRTSRAVGLRFTIANPSGNPVTSVTAKAKLLDKEDKVLDTLQARMETEHIDDLAVGESWQGDMMFEGFSTKEFGDQVGSVKIWATAEAKSEPGSQGE